MLELSEEIEDYKKPVSFGYGVQNPKYMLVGISGGRLGCIQTGVPFTKDMSGRLFQRVMNRLGYSRTDEFSEKPEYDNIYVTNLVKGVVLTTDGNNRAPSNKEIRYWMSDMLDEIDRRIKPKFVIALGSVVYDYLKDETFSAMLLKLKHPAWYGRMGALNEASIAWHDMVAEYTEVLGKND